MICSSFLIVTVLFITIGDEPSELRIKLVSTARNEMAALKIDVFGKAQLANFRAQY